MVVYIENLSASNSCFGVGAVSSVMYLLGVDCLALNRLHRTEVCLVPSVTGLVPAAV